MAAKRKYHKFITPKGTLRYPRITKPDYGNEKFPKPNGEYSVQAIFRLDDPAFQSFLERIQPHYDDALAKAEEEFKKLKIDVRKKLGKVTQNPLYGTIYDPDTEEETGEVVMKFACGHSYVDKKTDEKKLLPKPDIFDAYKRPAKGVDPWSGTTARVAFSIEEGGYFIPGTGAAGLRLRLDAVQIIDLVEGGSRSADSYGFDEEDGFDGSGRDVASDDDASGDDDSDDATDF
jgi:hypothetical protein